MVKHDGGATVTVFWKIKGCEYSNLKINMRKLKKISVSGLTKNRHRFCNKINELGTYRVHVLRNM